MLGNLKDRMRQRIVGGAGLRRRRQRRETKSLSAAATTLILLAFELPLVPTLVHALAHGRLLPCRLLRNLRFCSQILL
jgi:hypothetical protein